MRFRLAAALVAAFLVCARGASAAGPDAFGYRALRSVDPAGPPYLPFVDISTSGTRLTFVDADDVAVPNADDGVALDLPLTTLNGGRGFPFYGAFRTAVTMSTNGFLDFEPSPISDIQQNQCPLPNPSSPNTLIAALWDDLVLENPPDPTRGGYQQAFPACPYPQGGDGACVVFQWHQADHLTGSVDAFSVQAVLYENGNVLVNFPPGNLEEGVGSTTGIEARGVVGLTVACNLAASVPGESAVLFLAPPATAASVAELEPNDAVAAASALAAGRCGAGAIDAPGDVDLWALPPGASVWALVDTGFAVPSATSFLEVLPMAGSPVLAADADSGPGAGSAVAGVPVPAGGALLRVGELGSNAKLAPYELSALVAAADDTLAEVEPNDAPAAPNPVAAPVMRGTLAPGDADVFVLRPLVAGDVVAAVADTDPGRDGALADVVLEILGPDGATVLATSEPPAGRQAVAVRAVAPADGAYWVRVTQAPGAADGGYALAVLASCAPACWDDDGDGRCNAVDDCPALAGPPADTDGDGAGDACDACPADPAKVEPGACGCGVPDADSEPNGVPDCRANDELRERLARLRAAVESLRRRRGAAAARTARERLEEVRAFLDARAGELAPVAGADVTALAQAVHVRVRRATKVRRPGFAKSRRKALAAVDALAGALT